MKIAVRFVFLTLVLFVGSAISLPGQAACAQELNDSGASSLYGIAPKIPKAKGDKCIAPTEFMRRNHMKLLLHDRDETVRLGNREIKASLKACIACHAVNGADNKPVDAEDPKFFCNVCHDYAAVKVDCFQCHASRPKFTLKSEVDPASLEAKALAAYAKEAD